MSAPLSYTPYQSHRRAASSASFASTSKAATDPTPQPSTSSTAEQRSDNAQQSTSALTRTVISKDASRTTLPRKAAPLAATSNPTSSSGAPPPLRSASSLRSAHAHAPVSTPSPSRVLLSKGKQQEDLVRKALTQNSPGSKSDTRSSTSLAVPSSSANAATLQRKEETGTHFDRGSSPPPQSFKHGHSRSLSSSTIPANLPHIMSTAQRLRTASPIGQISSMSTSPVHTPIDSSSPSLEPSIGRGQLPGDHIMLPGSQALAVEDLTNGRRTAYRPGFQPKGTYRVRTDEFDAARARRRTRRDPLAVGEQPEKMNAGSTRFELQSERLERRLEKLLAIHYDDSPLFTTEEAVTLAPTWLPNAIRKARLQAEADRRVREQEMHIVKWEDDKKRKSCAICSTSFSITVRKHHCRLCGRLVCASPHLTMPPLGGVSDLHSTSKEGLPVMSSEAKCSSLMISAGGEGSTKIKEVPRWDESIGGTGVDQDGRTRGMRICRDCKETIMHRQYMLDDGAVPAYIKLYETLISLQREIEQSLPEFQEMIMGLQKHDAVAALGANFDDDVRGDPLVAPPSRDPQTLQAIKAKNRTALALQRDAAQARKQLLANFANYDLVAKKIRALDDEGNVSLARIKTAIYTRANVFLQTYMFPLQNLPKLSSSATSSGRNSPSRKGSPSKKAMAGTNGAEDDQAELRESLVVLEQQLTQVRQFAASASKARKLQDASSLNASAKDLEAEIARIKKQLRR